MISFVKKSRPTRSYNIIMNHWRGLYSLGVSYWVFGSLATIADVFVTTTIFAVFAKDDGYQPVPIFFAMLGVCLSIGLIAMWQSIGIWRSADRAIEERRLRNKASPWAGIAKFMVIMGILRLLVTFGTSTAPQLEELFRMAFRGDPTIPAYAMRIMRNGTEVEIVGGFKYGLTDDFKKLLRASPQIVVVHLNSLGGRIGEAIKLNKVIRDANLKTFTSDLCASACTIAFAGGRERWLYRSANLGFHGGAFPGLSLAELNALNDKQRLVMISSGFDAAFVSRALSIASTELWKPTIAELKKANVITAVSNGTQFAASGYGGTIQKQIFVEPLTKNVPTLASLKERYPEEFNVVLDAYYKGYVDGRTEEENNNILRFFSYYFVLQHIEYADNQAIVDFAALLIDELLILKARNVDECAKFGSKAGKEPDIQYSFPDSIMRRYQIIGAEVIQTSTLKQLNDKNQAKTILMRTIAAMSASFPQWKIALLAISAPSSEQAGDYCTAIIGLYKEILKAKPEDAAVMLRSLMKST